ncbi:uncharacterized protein TRIADDRAFT_51952 [Trichoplax adhaerens]|uniref:N-acetylgalactosamine kinase n=1 Tax=Trichoplax adhaerens TaxID=10228 RepID=B3RLB9_TRIAD|nr:hypothetical protein TRIADDRAFT_51952 [Trichoplax adhaerens]EDV28739.1 hypothetical protein TRIADDRAFT_51952 [Trichoplax adhaerens]|eukprot:XP_002107941.1 hypothetical protein TRIADDRAFT_51952 [Trichoplax adhaerens]
MEGEGESSLIVHSLADIYPGSSQAANERYRMMNKMFTEKLNVKPQYFARAPGRVNIIGEHIDYCGYGVFPMALEQDIVIAVAVNQDQKLRIFNTNEQFKSFECDCNDVKIDGINWYHYFLCGYKGICEALNLSTTVGMDVLVDGTIPKSAGLSSSSALVCCAGLATLRANNGSLSRVELAEVCAACERYIGTQGGGMDQSISFLAEGGKAKLIEFNPLRATNVNLPADSAFVISNCMVEMKKSETASTHFNVRVAECVISAKILAQCNNLKWKDIKTLGELQKTLDKDLNQMLQLIEKNLHKDPYTRQEICSILKIEDSDFEKHVVSSAAKDAALFKLYDRSLHVYSEANRVLTSKKICDEASSEASELLGRLMSESHSSCSSKYECSCPELDKLVEACMSCGSLGSRLTGAGWGGCAVSIVRKTDAKNFVRSLFEEYYACKGYKWEDADQILFSTEPGTGAALYLPN